MVNSTLLQKYLAGNSTEEESRRCEAFLNDLENLENINELVGQVETDSLLETLNNLKERTKTFESSGSSSLIEQIQSLVPSRGLEQRDLDQVLGPGETSEELGRIGRYRVIEVIAAGGMGIVFRAEDSLLGRPVCIKVLHPSLADNTHAKARFVRESKAAATLRHSRIVTILEFGEHQELPYLVMELLDGESLRHKLNTHGSLDPQEVRKLAIQIAQGLQYAHQFGLLHRDVKPENIWITPEGDVKLLDFGLVRPIDDDKQLTHAGTILGTPNYMSPEQVQGQTLDQRSDLFSVGSVMYEMLTGRPPFGKNNLLSTMMSVANETLTYSESLDLSSVPQSLIDVVAALLQKDPNDRFSTTEQLITALENEDFTKDKTSAGTSNLFRFARYFSVALAGAACLAFGVFCFQLNNKGTLVVEADPSVTVNISGQRVSVEDPQTGRRFEVEIGAHPLPSGVYQLQMADASGNYTVSSEVISIRRGDKQIVKIQLKPNSLAEKKLTADKLAPQTSPAPENLVALSDLPTLTAQELSQRLDLKPGKSLYSTAIVSQPKALSGVSTWNIELTNDTNSAPLLNSNGTCIAFKSLNHRSVVICNRAGEVLHFIPAEDKILDIAWSPQPDVVAVIEHGKTKKRVKIWKLLDKHIEAIDVIACSGERLGWSFDGLKLAVQAEREISFVDLTKKGGVYAQPNLGIAGSISPRPWSSNGKYFATTIDGSVKVWDLERQIVIHTFSDMEDARFIKNNNWISIAGTTRWEVWDLENFQRKSLIEWPESWVAAWPDPSFTKMYGLTQQNEFELKDVATGTVYACKIDFDWTTTHRGQLFPCWSADSRNFVLGNYSNGTFLATQPPGQPFKHLTELKQTELVSRKYVPIARSTWGAPSILLSQSEDKIAWHKRVIDGPAPVSIFDLDRNESMPDSEVQYTRRWPHLFRVSPDGKYIAIFSSDAPLNNKQQSIERWLEDAKKVKVCSSKTGEIIKTFHVEGRVNSIVWGPDSKRLVVSAIVRLQSKTQVSKRKNVEQITKIVTIDNDKETILDPVWKNADKAKASTLACFQRTGQGFSHQLAAPRFSGRHIVLPIFDQSTFFDGGSRKYSFRQENGKRVRVDHRDRLGFFDIETGKMVKSMDLDVTFDENRLAVTDRMIMIGHPSKLHSNNRDSFLIYDRQHGNRAVGTTANWRELKAAYRSGQQSTRRLEASHRSILAPGEPFLSPSHPHIALLSKMTPSSRIRDPKKIRVWKLDSKLDQLEDVGASVTVAGNTKKIVWHKTEPAFAWRENKKACCYSVTENRVVKTVEGYFVEIFAIKDGWLLVNSSRIERRDNNFNLTKTWLTTAPLTRENTNGVYDQCVTNSGEILQPENQSYLRAVLIQGNRIETKTIPEFEKLR